MPTIAYRPVAEWAAKCRICSAPLTRHQHYSDGLCASFRCRETALQAELKAHRDATAAQLGMGDQSSVPVAVIPWYQNHGFVPVPAEQRDALRQHIIAIASATAASDAPALPVDDATADDGTQPATMAARACAVCAGYCCRLGHANMAFIDAQTIARARSHLPDRTPDALADAYLAWAPMLHSEGSCVFHGERGCTVPRHLRATICNEYECGGLRDARRMAEREGARTIYMVVRHAHAIRRGAFVDSEGTITASTAGA